MTVIPEMLRVHQIRYL